MIHFATSKGDQHLPDGHITRAKNLKKTNRSQMRGGSIRSDDPNSIGIGL